MNAWTIYYEDLNDYGTVKQLTQSSELAAKRKCRHLLAIGMNTFQIEGPSGIIQVGRRNARNKIDWTDYYR